MRPNSSASTTRSCRLAASTSEAHKPGAPLVWDEAPNNVWFAMERGDKAATDAAFARAAHVVSLKIVNNRLSANSIEGRTALAEYEPTSGKTTLHTSTQQPHKVRAGLAGAVFREPEMKFRVVSPDVGGGFGMKGGVFPEDALVTWAARKTGRPVKWVSERSEGIMSDCHGRDSVSEASLALDKDGKVHRPAGRHQLLPGRLSYAQRRRAGRHGLDRVDQRL